ncbi:MAG: RHS repeat-associated core domain-containing protein [Planctomycetes bacterium]|nr:RHS repeat-associated core domain-containing protein [Planctomycetota bacterium]
MPALPVVELEIHRQRSAALLHAPVVLQVHLLVLHASPQTLDHDVIERSSLAVHADPDARLFQTTGERRAGVLAPLGDANFNITTLVDTAGDALERYVYTPYGVLTIYDATWSNVRGTSTYSNSYTYTGRQLDAETGLYCYRHRMYAAQVGRFASRDPYSSDDCHRYCYVAGNPLGNLDPDREILRRTELVRMRPRYGGTVGNVGIRIEHVRGSYGTCGAFSWTIQWVKQSRFRAAGSYLVQQVDWWIQVLDCADNDITKAPGPHWSCPHHLRFWEAWQISEPGELWGAQDRYCGNDTYTHPGFGDCTKGTIEIDGIYGEVTGVIPRPPFVNGGVPEGWGLPSTLIDPQLDMGHTRHHQIIVKWNCRP